MKIMNVTSKEHKKLKMGQLVFAKVRGFPPWPAKITKVHHINKFSVYFYGTQETGDISRQNLFTYHENKNKYATEKNLKRRFYGDGIAIIESVLKGKASDPAELFIKITETLNDKENVPPNEMKSNVKRKRDCCNEVYDTTVAQPAKKMVLKEGDDQTDDVNMETDNLEDIARTCQKEDGITPNLLLCLIKNEVFIGINLDYKKPLSFASNYQRTKWEVAARKKAEELKNDLEARRIKIKSVRDQIVLRPPIDLIITEFVRRLLSGMSDARKLYLTELFEVFKCRKVRKYLGLQDAFIDDEFKIWNKFDIHEVIPLLLIRFPYCMDIIAHVRHFVEVSKPWVSRASNRKISTDDEIEKLRRDAVKIYYVLSKVFHHKKTSPWLWDGETQACRIPENSFNE
ncbi:uncharacterized protein LOC119688696 [Teleopsis dalmanni]|uniref:uncharacterized protein LOC119688696 n=1 Tax=Teleopsis dalmanni TaxID=139649 RepID=UPI0018CE8BF0|nr:uncharacterized protein LOC119688696 [Teleopsis dalmanni]